MAVTSWGNYPDAFFAPVVTALMPLPAAFMGTGPRNPYTGVYSVLGYYSVFTAGWGGGAHLPGGPYTVSGQTKDPSGNNVSGYTVRLYDQATGELLAETTSGVGGVFTFDQLDTREVYVVAIDNVSETWKAPIVDRVVGTL